MRRMINKLTGGDMWIADNRVDDYLAAGHKLAASDMPADKEDDPEEHEDCEEEDEHEEVKASADTGKKPAAKRTGKRKG